jgi:hypothetical protein
LVALAQGVRLAYADEEGKFASAAVASLRKALLFALMRTRRTVRTVATRHILAWLG